MTRTALPVLFLLPLLIWTAPSHAQQADSTAADTTRQVADVQQGPADTATADTMSVADRRRRAEQAAQTAAEEWLALVDAGDFYESWEAADSTFQARLSQEDWVKQGIQARSQLDSLRSRELSRVRYTESMPQIPGGQPVVLLRYATEYATGATLEAVITTKRDTAWKVVGYRMVPEQIAGE